MNEKTVRASFTAFDGIDSPDKVPSEVCLLKSGVNQYFDGELLFDGKAAESVMARYQTRGIRLKADYEHQSMQAAFGLPPVISPASAKRWTPVVRDGALWATDIQWTKKARQMIADGEYDYFSIAARVEPETKRVVEMINFALTNTPAANGIEPLIAASIAKTEPTMKTVIVALGLRADAEEADALAAVSQLKEFEREIVTLSGAKDRASAIGAIVGLKSIVAGAESVKTELETLKKSTVDADCKRALDEATAAGKLAPAKRADVEGMYAKYGIDAVKSMLSMLPVVVQSAAEAPRPIVGAAAGDVELSAQEIAIAKNVCGSPGELELHLKNLREYKKSRANAGR